MNFEVKDLTGLGQPLTKLLDVIQASCGKLYEPTHIRRIARAQADGHKLLETAKVEALLATGKLIENAEPTLLLSSPGISTEIAHRAQIRLAHREVLQQQNIDQVVAHATKSLPDAVSEEPVDQDWANRFFSVAADVSDEKMQSLWGKILAGETATPGRFSVRTLDVLRNLSHREAESFRSACALSFGKGSKFIVQIPDRKPGALFAPDPDALSKFGLRYHEQIALTDAGVIAVASDGVIITHDMTNPLRIAHQGKTIRFSPMDGVAMSRTVRSGLTVLVFTTAGSELSSLVENDLQEGYISLLIERFKPYGIEVTIEN